MYITHRTPWCLASGVWRQDLKVWVSRPYISGYFSFYHSKEHDEKMHGMITCLFAFKGVRAETNKQHESCPETASFICTSLRGSSTRTLNEQHTPKNGSPAWLRPTEGFEKPDASFWSAVQGQTDAQARTRTDVLCASHCMNMTSRHAKCADHSSGADVARQRAAGSQRNAACSLHAVS